jgi:hypothetical protein
MILGRQSGAFDHIGQRVLYVSIADPYVFDRLAHFLVGQAHDFHARRGIAHLGLDLFRAGGVVLHQRRLIAICNLPLIGRGIHTVAAPLTMKSIEEVLDRGLRRTRLRAPARCGFESRRIVEVARLDGRLAGAIERHAVRAHQSPETGDEHAIEAHGAQLATMIANAAALG